jgi:predicted transcriptional regulator
MITVGGSLIPSFLPRMLSLYSRLSEDRLSTNVRRARILDYIEHNPGARSARISEDLMIPRGTLRYHLGILEDSGKIKSLNRSSGKEFYLQNIRVNRGFPSGEEMILDAINIRPGITQNELVSGLGTSRSNINRILLRLLHRGKIRRSREGRIWKFYPL